MSGQENHTSGQEIQKKKRYFKIMKSFAMTKIATYMLWNTIKLQKKL